MRRVLAGLAFVQVLLAFLLPVIPGHDLPQHLAYARIIAGADEPLLARLYDVDTSDPYCTVHRLLAWATRWMSLDLAARTTFALYALATVASFGLLGRALYGRRGAHVAMLGVALVWNPIACMGFLPFLVTLPVFVLGSAVAVVAMRQKSLGWMMAVLGMTVLVGKLHIVGMAFFVLFGGLLAIAAWKGRSLALLAAMGAGALVVLSTSQSKAAHLGKLQGFAWSGVGEKTNMILATVFGPFPHSLRLGMELGALGLTVVVAALRSRSTTQPPHEVAFRRVAFAFAAIGLFIPSSVRQPDDLSYLDFRFFVFALALLLASIPPSWFRARAARGALAIAVTLVVGVWVRQLMGAAGEATVAIDLVSRLRSTDRLFVLSFHDRSAYFDESNGINHYLGVHHTAQTGGVTSLFWGKYAHHLPVGYRPGVEPARPPDWRPGDFTLAQLEGSTHVLVSWPDSLDGRRARAGAARFRDDVRPRLRELACRSVYCLYAVESGSR